MIQRVSYKNGNSLAYTEFGDKNGFPILIQHGLIASISDYALFAPLAEPGTRLISIARPGYGESSPYEMKNIGEWGDIVSVVVAELLLNQFDVLGMSSGAPYSYALGYKFPQQVRNIFILSGIPALYDKELCAYWLYPVQRNATISQMQKLAHEFFFSNLSAQDLVSNAIQDSMRNDCFGVAQDLKIRGMDWGFRLADVNQNVYMRHSRADQAVPFITAEMTCKLLPHCQLDVRPDDPHFSPEVLDNFIQTVMASHFEQRAKLLK